MVVPSHFTISPISTVIERVRNSDTTLWIPVSFNAINFAVENFELIRPGT